MGAASGSFVPAVPTHVPPELVRPLDFSSATGFADPYEAVAALQRTAPRIFYTTYNNPHRQGAWVLTRLEDIREVMMNPGLFSSAEQANFAKLLGGGFRLPPIDYDPPEHTLFRKFLNPLMSPKRMLAMRPRIMQRARELIGPLRGQSACEFMAAFGRPFPVSIFMELMGLPHEEMDQFVRWEHDMLRSGDLETRTRTAGLIRDYLMRLIEERRRNPGDDLTSHIATGEMDGRRLSDGEALGVCVLLFLAGLDTVASSLGFHFLHLATNPDNQMRLRQDPALIPSAMHELVRAFPVATVHRRAVQDCEIAGAQIQAGDWIMIGTYMGARDDEAYEDPARIDFSRGQKGAATFAFGPHHCLGAHLARLEIEVAVEAWIRHMPGFALDPRESPVIYTQGQFGVGRLPLSVIAA